MPEPWSEARRNRHTRSRPPLENQAFPFLRRFLDIRDCRATGAVFHDKHGGPRPADDLEKRPPQLPPRILSSLLVQQTEALTRGPSHHDVGAGYLMILTLPSQGPRLPSVRISPLCASLPLRSLAGDAHRPSPNGHGGPRRVAVLGGAGPALRLLHRPVPAGRKGAENGQRCPPHHGERPHRLRPVCGNLHCDPLCAADPAWLRSGSVRDSRDSPACSNCAWRARQPSRSCESDLCENWRPA